MDPTLVLCLLAAYLLIGFALGWIVAHQRRGTAIDAAALDDLRLNIAQQAIRLNGFRHQLEAAEGSGATVDPERVEEAWESNRLFEQQLDSGSERLAQAVGDESELQRLLEGLREHRSRVHDFNTLLEQSLEQNRPGELAGSLVRAVSELCESNRNLETELQEARRTIAAQQSRLEQAERDARVDSLTKLANRRAFDERIDACQARFDRGQEEYAVVLFDLDRFKLLNDEYGHRTGDAVLAVFGRILAESVRGYDQAARLGGEEFAAILPSAGVREARIVAERCRRRVEQAVVHQMGHEARFTVSAGLAAIHEGETPAALLERADTALYEAKMAGRNCVRVSDFGDAAAVVPEHAQSGAAREEVAAV